MVIEFPAFMARYCRAENCVPLNGDPSNMENSLSSQLHIIFTPLITMVEQPEVKYADRQHPRQKC